MKIKKGYLLREMAGGVNVVVGVGNEANTLKGYVTLNDSGALIWKVLEKGASLQDVVSAILSEYEVEEEIARKDAILVIEKLKEIGALDD
ncbi:MAG: PqqD family protein [Clostridia bacterium]|nr:PqqD family protein [Clostridia bacterium]